MDKILEFGEMFAQLNEGANNFNIMLLFPVIVVVVVAIGIFMFGFRRVESPQFRKLTAPSSSGGNNSVKRKKRNTVNTSGSASSAAAEASPQKTTVNAKKEHAPVAKTSATAATANKKPIPSERKPATKAATKATKMPKSPAKGQSKSSANATNKLLAAHDDEGEWKTVITKKQKKQITSGEDSPANTADAVLPAVAELATGASNKKAAKANSKAAKVAPPPVKSSDEIAKTNWEAPTVEITSMETVVDRPTSAIADVDKSAALDVNINAGAGASSTIVASEHSSVVFDELGDAEWSQPKSQKKQKKRALRE